MNTAFSVLLPRPVPPPPLHPHPVLRLGSDDESYVVSYSFCGVLCQCLCIGEQI